MHCIQEEVYERRKCDRTDEKASEVTRKKTRFRESLRRFANAGKPFLFAAFGI